MSDRNVRNPADALAQRLGRLEERVRALSLRTWPGAVRTGMNEFVAVETPPTEDVAASWTELVSVTADPGRWVVFGHTSLVVNPVAAGYYNLQAGLRATYEGVVVSDGNGDYDFHKRVEFQSPVTAGSAVYRTMTVIGHYTAESPVSVSLVANSFTGDAFSAEDSCLLLLPV